MNYISITFLAASVFGYKHFPINQIPQKKRSIRFNIYREVTKNKQKVKKKWLPFFSLPLQLRGNDLSSRSGNEPSDTRPSSPFSKSSYDHHIPKKLKLIEYINNKGYKEIKALLDESTKEEIAINKADVKDKVAIHYAIHKPNVLKLLLTHPKTKEDIDVNITNSLRETPIMLAARFGKIISVMYLLERKDINLYYIQPTSCQGEDVLSRLLQDLKFARRGEHDQYLRIFTLLINPKIFQHNQRLKGHILLDCVDARLPDFTKIVLQTGAVDQETYNKAFQRIIKDVNRRYGFQLNSSKYSSTFKIFELLNDYYKNNIAPQKEQITNL